MRNKSTWVFLIFVAILGAFTAWDLQSDKKSEEKKIEDSVLIPFQPEQIQTFSISNKSHPDQKITLDKTVDGWKLTSPVQDWADSAATDDFLLQLTKQKALSTVTKAASDSSIYGLSQPEGDISITHQNKENIALEVGSIKTFEQNTYLRKKEKQQVFVGSPDWLTWVQKNPSDFRDRRFLRGKLSAIQKIEIKNGQGSLKLEKKQDTWIANGHSEISQDQNRIREMLSQFNVTKADEIIAEKNISDADQKKYGISEAQVQVFIDLGDKKWQARIAQNKDKSVYAMTSDPVFLLRLDQSLYKQLKFLKASSFKDRTQVFSFNKESAQSIVLQTALKKQVLSFKAQRWVLLAKESEQPLEEKAVPELLTSLSKLGLIEFIDSKLPFKGQNKVLMKDAKEKTIFELAWDSFQKIKIDDVERTVAIAKTSQSPDFFYIEQKEIDKLKLLGLIPTK